jgi:hypothetical protein
VAHRRPCYQQVSQSAAISVLAQAIMIAGSVNDTDRVIQALRNNSFSTVYGKVSFDENGHSKASILLLQYAETRNALSSAFEVVYPMPTWKSRDCKILSNSDVYGRRDMSVPRTASASREWATAA